MAAGGTLRVPRNTVAALAAVKELEAIPVRTQLVGEFRQAFRVSAATLGVIVEHNHGNTVAKHRRLVVVLWHNYEKYCR